MKFRIYAYKGIHTNWQHKKLNNNIKLNSTRMFKTKVKRRNGLEPLKYSRNLSIQYQSKKKAKSEEKKLTFEKKKKKKGNYNKFLEPTTTQIFYTDSNRKKTQDSQEQQKPTKIRKQTRTLISEVAYKMRTMQNTTSLRKKVATFYKKLTKIRIHV